MALICNDATVVGKTKQIWCDHTGQPCMHTRYCAISMKYKQTEYAARCKVRLQKDGKQKD